jgi:hypothetical protein
MQYAQWFQQQLKNSADGFLWAVEQIPQERLYLAPRPDRWPVARLVYHLANYEGRIGLPSIRQWLGDPKPEVGTQEEDTDKEDVAWNNGEGHEITDLIATFKAVRAQQLESIRLVREDQWLEERPVIWGIRSLQWVVTKTYQHTLEHTDEILRAYLWWR